MKFTGFTSTVYNGEKMLNVTTDTGAKFFLAVSNSNGPIMDFEETIAAVKAKGVSCLELISLGKSKSGRDIAFLNLDEEKLDLFAPTPEVANKK